MKKIRLLLGVIISTLIISLILIPKASVNAVSAPYKTFTENRDRELVETQEAYTPISSMNIVYNDLSIKKAEDMAIDEDDYVYIADTGNKRILVLNSNLEPVYSFGNDDDDEHKLSYPRGIYIRDNYIYVTDYDSKTQTGKIFIYEFDKEHLEATLYKEYGTPTSWILETDGYIYKPIKIAVSENGYMYVTSEGSSSGVLMIDPDNNFITYFASNSPTYSTMDKIMYFLFEGTRWADQNRKIAPSPYNVMLNGSGYVYTITKSQLDSSGFTDNFKKVNTGGTNYFPKQMIGTEDFTDSYFGKYGNTYAISESGQIYEYDDEGNLLFMFSGKGDNLDVYGLFSSASSIVVNSKDNIYVIDSTRNNLQIFVPTTYCNYVHEALALYKEAKYEEALEIWQEVLRYNSMFDLAHKGVGLAYYMSGNYEEALKEFYTAYDKVDFSDSYWEIRNVYLINHLSTWILVVILFIVLVVVLIITNNKHHYLSKIFYPLIWLYNRKIVGQTLYSFRFLAHPADAIYEIKTKKKATVLSSTILLLLLFGIYIIGMIETGFYFNTVIIEKTILLTEGMKILIPIVLFIVANYLISALMDGEGKFKYIYINTISSLTPIIVIYPFVILISNFLTASESFLYYFLIVAMFIWSGILLFYTIKETHNYSVPQTLVNILLTIFMLLILILVILILYVMGYQVVTFIEDIIKEAIINA